MEKPTIGLMQGRLSPMTGSAMQFFPNDWEKEFAAAAELGLKEIELVLHQTDEPNWFWINPKLILAAAAKHGLSLKSVLADIFIEKPLRPDNLKNFEAIVNRCAALGVSLLEIPFVEKSAITPENCVAVYDTLRLCCPILQKANVRMGLETDLHPNTVGLLLEDISHPLVGANYDTGNSAAAGFDPDVEIPKLGMRIFNVHIKDRPYKAKTVPLGAGAADFDKIFKNLKAIGYSGPLILQAARSPDGDEKKCVSEQIQFVKSKLEAAWI